MIGEEYVELKQIGQGAFGRALLVQRCAEPDKGQLCVIKQINVSAMGEKARREAEQEVKVLHQLRHPYIIGYMTYFITTPSGSAALPLLNIVLEYAAGGDLSQRIKATKDAGGSFAEDDILVWFAQVSSALEFVHSNKILHRDIKSQNIFLTKDSVAKLGDFGIARVRSCARCVGCARMTLCLTAVGLSQVLGDTHSLANTVIGTPYYMSPELCENAPYSFKSDVWALGCVLYELACLNHAFEAQNMCALILKIIRGKYPPMPDRYSPELRDLVALMLQPLVSVSVPFLHAPATPHDRVSVV